MRRSFGGAPLLSPILERLIFTPNGTFNLEPPALGDMDIPDYQEVL